MAEKGPLITEDELRNLIYDLGSHSPAARAIADRWTAEHFAESAEIEEAERQRQADEAAAKAADTSAPVAAALPGAGWSQPGAASV